MILTGNEIRRRIGTGEIVIEDFDESRLGPNSYNLRLGDELLVYTSLFLDPKKDNHTMEVPIPDDGYTLWPDRLYLAHTVEYTETHGLVPLLEGRSSIGRLGINIHATAGFGDIGFCGRWTLELSCVQPVKIYAGMEICQIYYHTLAGEIEKTYSGKYQGSERVAASRMWTELQKVDGEGSRRHDLKEV